MGIGQYDGHGEYCGRHTASEVFLILIFSLAYPEYSRNAMLQENVEGYLHSHGLDLYSDNSPNRFHSFAQT